MIRFTVTPGRSRVLLRANHQRSRRPSLPTYSALKSALITATATETSGRVGDMEVEVKRPGGSPNNPRSAR
jgi:hypothetical protein